MGLKSLWQKLHHTYTLQTGKAVKNMVLTKHKEREKAEILGVESVSYKADMWTSLNMNAYLAVTCHYIKSNNDLAALLLRAKPFAKSHTEAHIAAEIATLLAEWGLSSRIRCFVTDSASNILAANTPNIRLCKCVVHCLNVMSKMQWTLHLALKKSKQ